MKPYDELTRIGKIRRLRTLVFKALEQYELRVELVKFFTIETNTMFQIRADDGERYVLRIYSDEETTLRENQAELFWLDAIIRDTDLKVTEPVPRRDGDYITIVTVPGVPEERRCVLFKWIPGQTVENFLSPEIYLDLGRTMARLHEHAITLKPIPTNIRPKKWDKVFYYPDEPVVYNASAYGHLFPPERIELIDNVIAQADDLFAKLFSDESEQILIHADLHFWNVLLYHSELYMLDFEDVLLGYPVQDIAVTLSYGREREGYQEWKAAFKQGYCRVRKWPAENQRIFETLIAARSVNYINYVARIDPSPQDYIERSCSGLVRFLEMA